MKVLQWVLSIICCLLQCFQKTGCSNYMFVHVKSNVSKRVDFENKKVHSRGGQKEKTQYIHTLFSAVIHVLFAFPKFAVLYALVKSMSLRLFTLNVRRLFLRKTEQSTFMVQSRHQNSNSILSVLQYRFNFLS